MDTFKSDVISETILRRLLKQDIIYHIKVKSREKAKTDLAAIIYQQGKAVDYFVLILEGRVEVTVGKENMMFESGPFTYFGSQALTANIGIGKNKIRFDNVHPKCKWSFTISSFIPSRVAYKRKPADSRKYSVCQFGFNVTSYLYTGLHGARSN